MLLSANFREELILFLTKVSHHDSGTQASYERVKLDEL